MYLVYIGLASVTLSLLILLALAKFSTPAPFGMAPSAPERKSFRRWLLPLLLALAAAGSYWLYSSDSQQESPGKEQSLQKGAAHNATPATSPGNLDTAVKKLADKLANDPGNGDGWLLLAKTYSELERFPEAAEAYEKAAALLPPDAGMFADWADTYVMSKDRKWDAEARRIVERALAIDPRHVKTLALAGSEAFGRADYKMAIDYWKRMKAAAPADSTDRQLADNNIAEATARLSDKRPADVLAGNVSAVSGTVTVSPKLTAKVAPQDTVFIVAKGPDGGPPLAVQRFKAADLPVQFKLDDSSAVMPGRTISQVAEVVLSAKVSRSGQAEAQAGDIYGAPLKAKVGAGNLKLELDQER